MFVQKSHKRVLSLSLAARRPMRSRIDDLPAEQLRAALMVNLEELPAEEAYAIQDFIQRIGGRENALLAAEMLEELEG